MKHYAGNLKITKDNENDFKELETVGGDLYVYGDAKLDAPKLKTAFGGKMDEIYSMDTGPTHHCDYDEKDLEIIALRKALKDLLDDCDTAPERLSVINAEKILGLNS